MYVLRFPRLQQKSFYVFRFWLPTDRLVWLWSVISLIYLSNGNRWGARKG